MADKIEDGGPAFARPGFFHADGRSEYDTLPEDGMSLRDWFAGQLISRFAASDVEPLGVKDSADQFDVDCALREHWGQMARTAYIAADAMLEARKGEL